MATFTANPDLIRPELLDALDPYQREAVVTLDGPLLVVAGPGSGKTRVLTHRLAALVDAGVWPSKLLAVTFTNKAAREMKERLAVLIGEDDANRAHVSTFHSMCARILRLYHDRVGLPRTFTILDSDDSARVVARVCAASGLTEGLEPSEVRNLAKSTHADISRAKNNAVSSAHLMASHNPSDRHTGQLMEAYNQLMRQMGAVDFDDLLLYVLSLLQNDPEVATALRTRWRYVSVDEFQDTNAVQAAIVTSLVAEHHNLCVVGDADQSIYAFRGAQPAVVTSFAEDFPGAKVVILERNYRSSATICSISRAIIEPNEALFRSNQEPHAGPGEKAKLTGYASDLDEARAVVDSVRRRGGPLTEHAVLVRTNALTRSIEQELTRHHIAYDVVGTLRFVERAEVKDALAWLGVAMNNSNMIAFERALASPRRGVGLSTLAKVRDLVSDDVSPLTAARAVAESSRGKIGTALAEYVDAITAVASAAATGGPVAAVEMIYSTGGLRDFVKAKDAKEGTHREENLDQLLEMAREFTTDTTDPYTVVEEFLEMLSLASSEDDSDDEYGTRTDKVQILTMHSAKGKEFDHVYVIGCEEQVLPHSRALEEGEESIAEERRLFFVAASRARKTLELSWCAQRMRFGKVESAMPSRFLDDIPRTLLTVADPKPATTWGDGSWNGQGRRGGQGNGRWGTGGWTNHSGPRSSSHGDVRRAPARASAAAPYVPGQASAAKARPAVSALDLSRVAVGVRVRHAKFGDGGVVEVSDDTARVRFDSGTEKTLLLTVAPLELI